LASVSVLTSGAVSAGFVVALWLPDTLEAESEAAAVESASADHAFQVAFQTLPAQGRGSLHLEDPHSGNRPLKDEPIDP
jgi:hypothetical protein